MQIESYFFAYHNILYEQKQTPQIYLFKVGKNVIANMIVQYIGISIHHLNKSTRTPLLKKIKIGCWC